MHDCCSVRNRTACAPPRQAEAVRAGLATAVPLAVLSLFTWDEAEEMVCGRPGVDVNLLESVTEYSGCRREDAHVRLFWTALRAFGDEERAAFLRFCWGRTRLPLTADQFTQRFKLQSFGASARAGARAAAHRLCVLSALSGTRYMRPGMRCCTICEPPFRTSLFRIHLIKPLYDMTSML
jgi:HECT-domain (ubiquitin-transferase)